MITLERDSDVYMVFLESGKSRDCLYKGRNQELAEAILGIANLVQKATMRKLTQTKKG